MRLFRQNPAICVAIILLLAPCAAARADYLCYVPSRVHHVPPPGQQKAPFPSWFSGTNCDACGSMAAAPPYYPMTRAELLINDEVVVEWHATVPPKPCPQEFRVVFDSTHFPDGTPITVTMRVTDSRGMVFADSGTAPAKNRGLVLGNRTFPGAIGTTEMNDVDTVLHAASFTTQPSDESNKESILAQIPPYQVFSISTHANSSVFEDCFGTGSGGIHAIIDTEVAASVSQKAGSQPPYWFVHLEGCHTAGDMITVDPWFANAFQVSAAIDRAFLGWRTFILMNDFNRDWNQAFWGRLQGNLTVYDAYHQTVLANGTKQGSSEENNGIAIGKIIGDPSTKVHGVYGGSPGQWYRQ